ncbi:MAG: putative quinol monooxygenase, partial [Erysipelotrichaceae bacterium]
MKEEKGNLKYDYFISLNDPETILLIDVWKSQSDIDLHHASPMMKTIMALREKYNLHMKVERFIDDDSMPEGDRKF